MDDVSQLSAPQLVSELNASNTTYQRYQLLEQEYYRRFMAERVAFSKMDYPVMIFSSLGFPGGGTLEVNLQCDGFDHPEHDISSLTLPYIFDDGSRRQLCYSCYQRELSSYEPKYRYRND